MLVKVCSALWLLAALVLPAVESTGNFLIGTGMYDITGESAEIGFLGYAVVNQKGSGIHLRPRARAFIMAEPSNSTQRVVYVSIDLCMGFQLMKEGVIDLLKKEYGNLYTMENVIISGTHTHSTPGGIGGTILVDITTLGFVKENWNAAVNGIYNAIVRAHDVLQPGSIKVAHGELEGANINRSPASFDRNPDWEKAMYNDLNTDHNMTVLRFDADNGTPMGMIAFYPVHGVSMNNTNTLVSGDNKGYASQLFERAMNPEALPGKGSFVAAFGQANEGDVSPNTNGPHCPDGSKCDYEKSTCGGKTEGCIASGPGANMEESTKIIGKMQYGAAKDLYDSASKLVSGPIDYRHTYVDMQHVTIQPEFSSTNKTATTCVAAMGYSFAAGTTDGPGDFDFTQGTNSTNPFWAFVSAFLAEPTADQIACQAPKAILLDVGLTEPAEWVPFILPEQIVRVGQIFILAVPGEFTTMSGRRLRATVQKVLYEQGVWTDDSHIVIAGLSNSYSHYVATYEEYQQQRYEGGSTLYGPHTLNAHQQNFAYLATQLATGQPAVHGPTPDNTINKTIPSFNLPVVFDTVPAGKHFGEVHTQAKASYFVGELVKVKFWGASPRNDLFTESSFLFVQKLVDGQWVNVADDSSWETKFRWLRSGVSDSLITIEWDTLNAESGTYRIVHQGVWKYVWIPESRYESYSGTSANFTVTAGGFNTRVKL